MSSVFAIEVKEVSKIFLFRSPIIDVKGRKIKEHYALKNVSFQIKKGESVGIIGPNGSGKSTLLKILAGITKPTSGEAIIRGRVASILDIGAGFHPELSGRENVFLNGQIHGFSKREIQRKFVEIVEFSGIRQFIEEPVKTYSNGMYLRLAFSIVMHLDFDIYLFDEVFSVGDAEFSMKTREKIESLVLKKKTVLLISHQLNELEDFDKIIRLENGNLKGPPNQENNIALYSEDVLQKHQIEIHQQNVIRSNFEELNQYGDVKLISLELFQNSEFLRTDKSLIFKITFQQLVETETYDIILVIKDVNDYSVFSSSPIASGNFNKNKIKGTYRYTCEVPAFFLFQSTYKVSLRFIKNAELLIMQKHEDERIYSDQSMLFDLNRFFNNILYFKTVFKIGNEPILLQPFYIQQKLFLGDNWKLDAINEK